MLDGALELGVENELLELLVGHLPVVVPKVRSAGFPDAGDAALDGLDQRARNLGTQVAANAFLSLVKQEHAGLWIVDDVGVAPHEAFLEALGSVGAADHLPDDAGAEHEVGVEDQDDGWSGKPEVEASREARLQVEHASVVADSGLLCHGGLPLGQDLAELDRRSCPLCRRLQSQPYHLVVVADEDEHWLLLHVQLHRLDKL